jgi:hypothetical protein
MGQVVQIEDYRVYVKATVLCDYCESVTKMEVTQGTKKVICKECGSIAEVWVHGNNV